MKIISHALCAILMLLGSKVSAQQKIEINGAGVNHQHDGLEITDRAFDNFSRYHADQDRVTQGDKLLTQTTPIELHRALWQHKLKEVYDHNGKLIAIEGVIKDVKKNNSHRSRALAYMDQLKGIYHIDDINEELTIIDTEVSESGYRHTRLLQQHAGFPLYGGDLIIHEDDQKDVYLLQGQPINYDRKIDVHPRYSQDKVEDMAKLLVENFVPFSPSIDALMSHEQIESELNIYIHNEETHLVYVVDIYPNIGSKKTMLIDAHSGELLKEFDTLCKIHNHVHEDEFIGKTTGTSQDLFGEQRTLNIYECSDGYFMVDASRNMFRGLETSCDNSDQLLNGVILTLDAGNTSPVNSNFDYQVGASNTQNNWSDPVAVSAHYNGGRAYEYFRNVFGRESITGNGSNIVSFVNVAEDDGSSMDNAYWNGEFIFYGNGNQAFNAPLAKALDVAGHEMAHGVIQTTANLIYQDESGALNEHFADVFGVLIERDDFRIGEDISNPSIFPTGALRDMSNPNNGGTRLGDPGYQPDHVDDQFFGSDDNGGVHINSGIPNKAFFNFVTDESYGTDNGSRAVIAEQIWYRALTTYLRSGSNFSDMRVAIVQSARELYDETVVRAAERAFDAVGIGTDQVSAAIEDLDVNPGNEYVVWSTPELDQINVTTGVGSLLGAVSTTTHISRPSVTDNGQFVIFVNANNQIQAVEIDWSTGGAIVDEFLVSESTIYRNAVISKDASKIAALTGDLSTGTFDNKIVVFDLSQRTSKEFDLFNPTFSEDNLNTAGVQYADVLEFDFTGENLIYDAFNQLSSLLGNDLNYWDIGIINVYDNDTQSFGSGNIFKLFTGLPQNVSIGNPTFSKNSPNIIAFDFREIDPLTDDRTFFILGLDRETGEVSNIFENNTFGFPNYSIEDDQMIFNVINNEALILAITDLNADKISASEDAFIFAESADWGVFMGDGSRDLSTSTEEEISATGVHIYPNPISDRLVIDLTQSEMIGSYVAVYDMLGQKVFSQEVHDNIIAIPSSEWESGSYIISINSGVKKLVKKIIKP